MPAPGLNAAAFLRLGEGQARLFWQAASSPFILAGFGIAAELKAWGEERFHLIESQARQLFSGAQLQDNLPSYVGPHLFGGLAFRDDFVPDNTWSVFHPAHFILPHFQFTQLEQENWLTINALVDQALVSDSEASSPAVEQIEEALAMRYQWLLQASERQAENNPPPGHTEDPHAHSQEIQVRYPMSLQSWETMVESALENIHAGRLRKVVLARMCEIRRPAAIDLSMALESLGENYPDCYRFLFEPQPQHAFFGATPELLASVNGADLHSMALAGSIRRGKTPQEDKILANELLNSSKDRHEHELVVKSIQQRLNSICPEIHSPAQPEVLRFKNIQHLHTPLQAQLQTPIGILPVIERLHPTPAMGGVPQEASMAFIRKTEPVTRGWYAAPIGWINHRLDGAFGVAIRSAVTQNERAWLYAGAGIVADSQPQKEWDETALKFRPALQALGLEAEILAET